MTRLPRNGRSRPEAFFKCDLGRVKRWGWSFQRRVSRREGAGVGIQVSVVEFRPKREIANEMSDFSRRGRPGDLLDSRLGGNDNTDEVGINLSERDVPGVCPQEADFNLIRGQDLGDSLVDEEQDDQASAGDHSQDCQQDRRG